MYRKGFFSTTFNRGSGQNGLPNLMQLDIPHGLRTAVPWITGQQTGSDELSWAIPDRKICSVLKHCSLISPQNLAHGMILHPTVRGCFFATQALKIFMRST